MTDQNRKAERFRELHVPGTPLVLFNVWDAGSAAAVARSGVQAVATSSWSVAAANGCADGERLPLASAIENLRRIVAVTDLPVSIDLESGYGETEKCVALAVEAGAVGCNLEDSDPATGKLREPEEQAARIRSARRVSPMPFFLNARTDVFFRGGAPPDDLASEVLVRARIYADAGANGLFVPGLTNIAVIDRIAKESPLPLNVMVEDATPELAVLSAHGVARVSHGPRPYLAAMTALEVAARAALRT